MTDQISKALKDYEKQLKVFQKVVDDMQSRHEEIKKIGQSAQEILDVIKKEEKKLQKTMNLLKDVKLPKGMKDVKVPKKIAGVKVRKGTMTAQILDLIQKSPKGISTENLIKKSGIDTKKVYNIIADFRAT